MKKNVDGINKASTMAEVIAENKLIPAKHFSSGYAFKYSFSHWYVVRNNSI